MKPFNFEGSTEEQCRGLLENAAELHLTGEQYSRLKFLERERPLRGLLYRNDHAMLERLKTRARRLYHKQNRDHIRRRRIGVVDDS